MRPSSARFPNDGGRYFLSSKALHSHQPAQAFSAGIMEERPEATKSKRHGATIRYSSKDYDHLTSRRVSGAILGPSDHFLIIQVFEKQV